jgi:uncharacterized membrane protein HdeD (DUF308 family)
MRPNAAPVDDPAGRILLLSLRAAWPVALLRGVLAVAFGLVALLRPDLTILALAIAFGIFAIVDGVARAVDAVRNRDRERWWVGLLMGLLGVIAGVVALLWPGITAVALTILVAAWALVTGIVEIVTAVRLRRSARGVWLLGLAGALSVVAGILLLIEPVSGAIGLAVLIGAFAIVYGVALAAVAVWLRGLA